MSGWWFLLFASVFVAVTVGIAGFKRYRAARDSAVTPMARSTVFVMVLAGCGLLLALVANLIRP